LNQIQEEVLTLQKEFEKTYEILLKELKKSNIHIKNEINLEVNQKSYVNNYFTNKVEPFISPIMLRSLPKFPYLKDKSVYLFVILEKEGEKPLYALIEIPTDRVSRFVVLPRKGEEEQILFLDDIIRLHLNDIFSGFEFNSIESYIIKLTRDAELDFDEDIAESFYEKISKSLEKRKKGTPVRLVYDKEMPERYLKYLLKKIKLTDHDNIIPGGRYHNFRDLMKFPSLGKKELVYANKEYIKTNFLENKKSIYQSLLNDGDLLLHFPYHSFRTIVSLIKEASLDEEVQEIKITIYRLASDSQIVNALINAARNGKEVHVVMELRARFDEKANLKWSKILEDEGIKVSFGIKGLKVHSKLILIGRKHGSNKKYYGVIGTGNFHEGTAKIYSDIVYLTTQKDIMNEVKSVFDFIEKPYRSYPFQNLLVAPINMRSQIESLINFEIKEARQGKKAKIVFKMNNLVDTHVIELLCMASQIGVEVKLIIRGICSLIPGIPELSNGIFGISIVDRYLEHARIMHFYHGGKDKIYITSGDMMTRNLDKRVEVAVPIGQRKLKQEIIDFLEIQLADNQKARRIFQTNSIEYVKNEEKEQRAQVAFFNYLKNKNVHS
ncbi:MAG: polyphosphate kinase 1, partial [Bacteroidota bacterium]|nr:polyphosphate kinase 1 [Bacteroidota bacterium]